MSKMLVSILSCALLMSGCDAIASLKPKLSGAEEILRVADQIDSGQIGAARKTVTDMPLVEISHIDPSSPDFCTPAGVETQLNNAADAMASDLLQHAEADPLTRYAMAKKKFDARFEMQDGIFTGAGYCPYNQGELTLAYSRARAPIAAAVATVLERMKAKAMASVTGDFDVAVAKAINDFDKAERVRFRDDCKARRAAPVRTGADADPLLVRAEAQLLMNCQLQGY